MWRRRLLSVVILAIVLMSAGCGAAASSGAATPVPEPTNIAAAAVPDEPPDVSNDAPAGICEETANILSRVDRAPRALFRAIALDNRVGQNDGDGIRGVRFSVSGEGITYARDETTAPYCIFGGNEPDCGDWPRDAQGRYTWGVGGPVVRPGSYQVFVEVFGEQVDSLSGNDFCNWNFAMSIIAP